MKVEILDVIAKHLKEVCAIYLESCGGLSPHSEPDEFEGLELASAAHHLYWLIDEQGG